MTLRQIETFYWAARLGSLTNAAKRLNATQSAVSTRIHELETHLGVQLFDRSQRTARLTPDGVSLLPLAERIVETTEKMTAAARHEAISGYVRLGVVEVIAHTWLPRFLEVLRNSYPHVQTELEVALSYVIEAKMLDGALDMALTAMDLPSSRFVSVELGCVSFRWMKSSARSNVPDVVSASELSGLPVILASREAQHRGSTLEWLTENEIRFDRPTICNTFVTAAALAKAGLGIALLPMEIYGPDLERNELQIVSCRPEIKPMKLIAGRNRYLAAPAHRAVEWAAVTASSFAGKGTVPPP